jgi:hypothetical protein
LSIRFSSAARSRTGSPITSAGSLSEISTADIARQHPQVEQILPDVAAGARGLGGVDEQRRQAGEMFGAGLDGIDPAPLALVEIRRRQEVADRKNSGERGADLMRECRECGLDDPRSSGRGRALAPLARASLLARGGPCSIFFRRPLFRRRRGAL